MTTTPKKSDQNAPTKPCPDQMAIKTRLGQLASEYIPHPLLRDVDKSVIDLNSMNSKADTSLKYLQLLLDNSNNQLRQYGTAKELAINLDIYQTFPMKHKILGSKFTDYCCIQPVKFKSLKGELFLHKHDFLTEIHLSVLGEYSLLGDPPSKLLNYMKNQQKQLDGCFEFVRYNDDVTTRIFDEYTALVNRKGGPAMANKRKEAQLLSNRATSSPKPQAKSKVRKVVIDVVSKSKKSIYNISSPTSDSQVHLEGLEEITNAHPELFLPYSETTNQNMPVVVRIFEDGSEKFVMKSELFKAINMRNSDQEPLKCDDKNGILHTMDLIEVFKTFKNQISSVEFIRSPITRASHAAVPIVTPSGDHCILAADVLLELLCRLISALKIFRKIKSDTWKKIYEYVSWLESKFPTNVECKYFIDFNVFNGMKKQTDEFWEEYENVHVKVAVRDVPKEGFTSKILKKELKYLGITDVFPEIINYAKAVHAGVDQTKIEKTLRTCDMFNALEHCQLICILKTFQNLKKILHTQKGCKRIPHMDCETCPIIFRIALTDSKETKCEDANSAEDVVENVEEEKTEENQLKVENAEKADETPVKEARDTDSNCLSPSPNKRRIPYVRKLCAKMKKEEDMAKEKTDRGVEDSIEKVENPNIEMKSDEQKECMTPETIQKLANLFLLPEEMSYYEENTKETETTTKISKEESNSKVQSQVKEKKKNVVPISDQSKCCPKCLRTSERCNEAMIELKMAQNKLAKNEKKAKNFDDLERKMKEKEKENEQLKRMNSKSAEELEALKLKISKTDLVEEKLKMKAKKAENKVKTSRKEYEEYKKNEELYRNETEKKFKKMETALRESNRILAELTENNEALEQEMIRLKEKRDGDQLSSSTKQNLEREISAKDRIINELRRTTSRLTIQNEEHEKANRMLLDRLSTPPSTPLKPSPVASSFSRKDNEIPSGMRFQLLGLQKIKDSFRNRNPLKHAEDMVETLISSTKRPEIDQLAYYELTQFEGKFRSYTHAVELFIQKLKKSEDGTDVSLLPEFPSFSERFMKEYWSELEKQPSTSSGRPSELADSECLICLANMRPSNKTIKCESCRRRFHSECASEWLKRKSVCPACNRGLLDPADYPNLF